ncbi:UDP-N-acetylmuramate--L-alanine ligase [Niabella insulamsoli]|uniref:UDP-N-acetylmuramate--L-alanine ligase n=1 Tax=Niabella insulamsoli TaxID=3144874 RepID=UPI0031FD2CFB
MTTSIDLNKISAPFFIGVAGAGMSAIAQYLQGSGMMVSGSDRFFNEGKAGDIRQKLEDEGIRCFLQDGSGITPETDLVVASTAIEDTVIEIKKAKELGIPIIRRSELLALIAASKKTIAVGGTSGKSTTTAMLFDIMSHAGLSPSIISGAGLVSLIKKGKIGNAFVGDSDWLVIEADESDGSIVQYHPEIGILLNIEKDHKELKELNQIFETFKQNSAHFIVNQSNEHSQKLSSKLIYDFEVEGANRGSGFFATGFLQNGFNISFSINKQPFELNVAGRHNMENALAAVAAASMAGVSLPTASEALRSYEGIYRRCQVLGKKNEIWVVDDFAHNPVKCAAAIRSCQPVSEKVIAWFQPHGYTPTKFLRSDFVKEIAEALRPEDEIWMSEIFYAGGTTTKDISANDLINDIKAKGKKAFFVENRNDFLGQVRPHLTAGSVLLLMGARDPSLEQFSKNVFQEL